MSIGDIALILTSTVFLGSLVYIAYILYKDPITSKKHV
jgi:hypothetical protein